MRTERRWLKQAALALAAGVVALAPALLPAQERDQPAEPADRPQQEQQSEEAERGQQESPEAVQRREQDRQREADRRQPERESPRTFRQDEERQTEGRGGEGREQAREGRAWLGVLLAPDEQGVRVVQVVPGSPAERAGIRVGDLLVGTEGQQFNAPEDVSEAVADEQPGSTSRFTIERQGREEEVEVELGRRPRAAQRGMPGFPGGPGMEGMMREFRGFGPDRELVEEHRRIQREHQQLKQQVNELQQQLRELRRELDQFRQQSQGGAGENAEQNR